MNYAGQTKRRKSIERILAQNIDHRLKQLMAIDDVACSYQNVAQFLNYNRNDYAAFLNAGKDIRFKTIAGFTEKLGVNLPVFFSRVGSSLLDQYVSDSYRLENQPEKYLENFRQNIRNILQETGKPLHTLYDRELGKIWEDKQGKNNDVSVSQSTILEFMSRKNPQINPLVSTLGWIALSAGYGWGDIGMLLVNPTLLQFDNRHLLMPRDKKSAAYLLQPADYKEE